MMPLVILLRLSLLVVIADSQQYNGTDILGETTFTAEDLNSFATGSDKDSIPEELKSKKHCRIPLDTDDEGHYVESNISDTRRTKRKALGFPWPGGRVPYSLSRSYWGWQKGMIWRAMKEIESVSCVKFTSKTSADTDYVFIAPISGCSASRAGPSILRGQLTVSLVYGCFYHDTILHELMHAIGFQHEHQRQDRDKYINVYMENVLPEFKHAYEVTYGGDTYNVEYEVESIMHYNSWEGCTCQWFYYWTMTKKNGKPIEINRRLSPLDIYRINRHYGCHGDSTKLPYPTTTTTTRGTRPPRR